MRNDASTLLQCVIEAKHMNESIQSLADEKFIEQKVTYTLQLNGQFIVIENVPARVNTETGEQLFSPDTVEHLQEMVWEQKQPKRLIQVPVYEFA